MLCAPPGAGAQERACFLSRIDGVEFKHFPHVAGEVKLPMNYALEGRSGIMTTKDYRLIPVVAAYAYLGAYSLGMVLKLDEEELRSQQTKQIEAIRLYLAAAVIAGILLVYLLMVPLVRRLGRAEREEQKANTELLRAKETAEQVSNELTAYIEAIGKLALVSVSDRNGRILYANARFCEVSGYSEAELIGQDHRILNSGTHPKEFFTEMWATITRGDVWYQEICNRSKQDQLYWLASAIVPLKDSGGKVNRYLSVGVDISVRKRQEIVLCERLKESSCLYAIRHDMELGLPVDEFCQKVVAHLTGAMQLPEIATAVIELDGRRFTFEKYDGEELVKHGLLAQITVNGEAHGWLQVFYREDRPFLLTEERGLVNTVADDLGRWLERKQARDQLRASELRLNEAQRIAKVGSWEHDLVSGKLNVSDEVFRIFEIDSHLFGVRYEDFLKAVHPDDRKAAARAHDDSLTVHLPCEITYRLRMPDGRIKWVSEHTARHSTTIRVNRCAPAASCRCHRTQVGGAAHRGDGDPRYADRFAQPAFAAGPHRTGARAWSPQPGTGGGAVY
jgi:PAS domain S-box-containing protein